MKHYRTILRDEVPNDDGSPTGRVFIYTQRFIGIDDIGEEEWIDTEVRGPYLSTDRQVVLRAKAWSESR